MKATKDHISLETGRLLKNCEVKSKREFRIEKEQPTVISDKGALWRKSVGKIYPCFTWQEILWEYPKEFFGEEEMTSSELSENIVPHEDCNLCSIKRNIYYTTIILGLLQQKKYEEADNYFRKHCILIK